MMVSSAKRSCDTIGHAGFVLNGRTTPSSTNFQRSLLKLRC